MDLDIFKFKMFNQGHFDSFQNTLSVIKLNLITNGEQFFGNFLFFIPRALWQDKPYDSGYLLADTLNYPWKNIALSYFGEGYVNFGYFGIIIFVILIAFFNSFLDRLSVQNRMSYFKLIYVPILFIEFFLLRGSLLSSISKLTMYFASLALFYILMKYIEKGKMP